MSLIFADEHKIAPSRTREDGWTYHLLRAQTPADTFGGFADIVELWQDKCGDGLPPTWDDFKPEELEPWWDWLTVIDLIPGDNMDGRFRHYGKNVQELLAQDLTGKTLRGDGSRPGTVSDGYTAHDFMFISAMTKRFTIGVATGSVIWQGRDHVVFSTLRLPIADKDEEIVTILSRVQVEN